MATNRFIVAADFGVYFNSTGDGNERRKQQVRKRLFRGKFLGKGKEVIEKALQLYYAMQAPNTPTWAKAVIIAALGYFISPIDAIPDVVPFVGFADDLGVLVAALAAVATYITDEVKNKADAKLDEWFGS